MVEVITHRTSECPLRGELTRLVDRYCSAQPTSAVYDAIKKRIQTFGEDSILEGYAYLIVKQRRAIERRDFVKATQYGRRMHNFYEDFVVGAEPTVLE